MLSVLLECINLHIISFVVPKHSLPISLAFTTAYHALEHCFKIKSAMLSN